MDRHGDEAVDRVTQVRAEFGDGSLCTLALLLRELAPAKLRTVNPDLQLVAAGEFYLGGQAASTTGYL